METTEWLGQCLEGASTSDSREECDSDRQEVLSDDGEEKVIPVKTKIGSKPHSTPLTLKWLEENYEVAERVCIPRSTLYVHYMDFCEKTDSQPVNAASFGKIIRQQFPHITTRRLGTRGQSKYHYYGVGVRETSIYYDVMFSAKGVDGGIDGKKDGMKQIAAYSPRSKLGTLLPDFPEIQDIKIPSGVDEGKVITFLMMYRTHCQRILDTVIRANFDEVQSFLLHFWQGMPSHMVPILDCETVIMLVGVCDSILYKAVASVLMPTVLQALPESLMQVIRKFARQLDDWLKIALNNLPNGLRKIKFDLARRFGQVLKRQTSLSHLCQTARTVVQSADITAQMLDDWVGVDLNSIGKQTLYTMDQYSERDHKTIFTLCTEFEKLLEDQAPMESYIEWLDSMVDRCVVQPGFRKPGCLRRIARQFLLMWSCFGTRIIRDMTLHSAASFGSFHLLHLMFDDYVLYLVENIHNQERANEYLRLIRGEQTQGDVEEMILPDPSVMKQNLVHSGGEAGLQELPDQSRDSIITSRNNMAQIDYDTNIDVMAPAMHHQDKLLLDTGRGCHLGSEGQGVASLYQNCASFSSSYPTSQQGDKTLAHLPPVTGSYSMPATQAYTSGSQLLDVNERALLSPVSMGANTGMSNGSVPQDWSGATQPRQAMGGTNTVLSLNRLNDPTNFQAYPAPLRQQGVDYGYMYETPPKGAGQSLNDSSSYLYHGYGHSSDYQMYGENNNKRRVETEGANRNYKRTKPDSYYYDNIQSGFA